MKAIPGQAKLPGGLAISVFVQASEAVVPVGGILAPALSVTITEIVQLESVTPVGAVQVTEQLVAPEQVPPLLKVPFWFAIAGPLV